MRPCRHPVLQMPAVWLLLGLAVWLPRGADAAALPPGQLQLFVPANRADKSWWSLQPLKAVEPPTPRGLPEAWSKNPIDRFIFARLAEKNLKPNPPANPRTLIRRMTYDVLGLPPTPEEVEAFEKAVSLPPRLPVSLSSAKNQETIRQGDKEIEKLVDRLTDVHGHVLQEVLA